MKNISVTTVRILGILLLNLLFIWLCIFIFKIFIVAGLFAEDIMRIDLSKSELQKLKFIKDVIVDPSTDSIWMFTAILFCFAAGSLICYRRMKEFNTAGMYLAYYQKFMRQNSTTAVWWFSAISSAILISLPPFTSFDMRELRKEKSANEKLLNAMEKERGHINYMIKTGKMNELKEEYPKFLDGQEFQLMLDQTTLTSYNLTEPMTLIPFVAKRPNREIGILASDRLEDILFFSENEIDGKAIEIEADLGIQHEQSLAALGFSLRAVKNICLSLEIHSDFKNGQSEELLLSHSSRRICLLAGELKEVSIDVQKKALPTKMRIVITVDIPADLEISDASLTLVKNYKERYFHSSYCLESKALAYPKNIRSFLYIPSFSAIKKPIYNQPFQTMTCKQAILGNKFNYPYS